MASKPAKQGKRAAKTTKPVAMASKAKNTTVKAGSAQSAKGGSAKKTVAAAAVPVPAPVRKLGEIAPSKAGFSKKEVLEFRSFLIRLREEITKRINSLAVDSLQYVDDTPSDDRTDDFDREFALNLVSSEQDAVFQIDEALRRIETGAYGMCDNCTKAIEVKRLKALPFAQMCLRCQSEIEKGRVRFRPLGQTIAESDADTQETTEETEEAE